MWRWPGEVVVADAGVCRQDMFGHVCEPFKRGVNKGLDVDEWNSEQSSVQKIKILKSLG